MKLSTIFFAVALTLLLPLNLSAKKASEYVDSPVYEATPWGLTRISDSVIANAISISSPSAILGEQVAATPRGAVIEFKFRQSANSTLKFDFAKRDKANSYQRVKWVSDRSFKGWIKFAAADGEHPANTIYFYCELSKKPSRSGFSAGGGKIDPTTEFEGDNVNLICEFSTREGEDIIVKTAISHTSIPGAMSNFRKELISPQSIAQLQADAISAWDNELSKIAVEGGSENDKTKFYTALYQSMLDPRMAIDVDGQYRGADNRDHTSRGYIHRILYCNPNQVNTLFPLLTIINPAVARDAMNSIIASARENCSKNFVDDTFLSPSIDTKTGKASISLLTDCVMKGLFPSNLPRALSYAENTAEILAPTASAADAAHTQWCLLQLAKTVGDSAAIQRHNQVREIVLESTLMTGDDPAEYVIATCGLRPLYPGAAAYEVTAPLFDSIVFNLDPDYFAAKTFTIKADRSNPGDNVVTRISLNGKPLKSNILTHKDLSQGGELVITLSGQKM